MPPVEVEARFFGSVAAVSGFGSVIGKLPHELREPVLFVAQQIELFPFRLDLIDKNLDVLFYALNSALQLIKRQILWHS